MTKVITLTSPRAGAPVHSSAHTTSPTNAPTCVPRPHVPAEAKGRRSLPFNGELRSPLVEVPTPHQQAAIENALSMALYFMRQPGDSAANLWAATARTNRALTLLKHASQGNALANAENALGRA